MATTYGSARGFHLYDSHAEALAGALAHIEELERGLAAANTLLGTPARESSSGYRNQFKPASISHRDWRRTMWNGSWETVSWAPRI